MTRVAAKVALKTGFYWRSPAPDKPGIIYLLKSEGKLYKIGCTVNLRQRLATLRSECRRLFSEEIELVHYFPCRSMALAENFLHEKYAEKRVMGEWFKLEDEDVTDIIGINRLGLVTERFAPKVIVTSAEVIEQSRMLRPLRCSVCRSSVPYKAEYSRRPCGAIIDGEMCSGYMISS
jgi:predicted GIY-YIG superfamily endonuclease